LDGDAVRAGQWLCDLEKSAANKKLANNFEYWRTVAVVRLAEGRQEEAGNAWRRANQLADRFPKWGFYEYDRELLNAVKDDRWLRLPEVRSRETSA
jgi:hypothetical protein